MLAVDWEAKLSKQKPLSEIGQKPQISRQFSSSEHGYLLFQERLKAAEAKRIEKERTEKYNKLKTDAKDARQKYREKYGLPESPPW